MHEARPTRNEPSSLNLPRAPRGMALARVLGQHTSSTLGSLATFLGGLPKELRELEQKAQELEAVPNTMHALEAVNASLERQMKAGISDAEKQKRADHEKLMRSMEDELIIKP